MVELFPLHGCERIGNEEPYPVSIDSISIVKKCEESEDKLEREENSSSDS